ncbi:class V chitinase-like [Humulus lupulus]|uniref:class V chitinase-like n=1 Tax=Humulus lupulus TaxID=3486 RepID=UPI002B404AAC|nr:class V chitinase-like [Humulus lupulus]
MPSKIKTIFFSIFLFVIFRQLRTSSAQTAVKAAYWFPESEFSVTSIDSSLFTVLFCAFAQLNPQNYQVFIPSQNAQKFSTFTSTVRRRNPSVKTLISIGGGAADKSVYAAMASDWNRRQAFIHSSISLARSNNFLGLDLDWEYPSTPDQMTQFGYLVDEWRSAVAEEARNSGRPPLLLVAAVFYSSRYETGDEYVVPALARSLDWINVMGYDFYAPDWSSVTGPPGALYNPGRSANADNGIRAWIQAGFPVNKIVLGFPFIGYGWTLLNPSNNGYFAPTTGAAFPDNGAKTYQQIKEFIANNRATAVFNSAVVSDYCYSGRTWFGYDDTQSIITKVRYIKEKRLRGYFAWHVGGDNNMGLSQTASQTWDQQSISTTHET